MDQYAEYVRKSRYDRDYGELSIEETLKRHQTILDAYAKKYNLNVVKTYREVVSGESISERPEMKRLLEDVTTGIYKGVLVIDIDRLSRGNSIDQGVVAQTFQYSDTLIVTPDKTYNPQDEFDAEYFEFGLFMSRKEYKIINRRLERGRKTSSKEGRFMGSVGPYGYEKVKIKGDKGNTLKIIPEEAEIVRKVFDIYLHEGLGFFKIADRLNDLHIPTRTGVPWSQVVIREIIRNCAYCGMIRVSYKKTVKKLVNGVVKKTRVYDLNCPKFKGLHDPIISTEDWNRAQEIVCLNNKYPVRKKAVFHNYYAGVLFCACGARMKRVTSDRPVARLVCPNKQCHQISSTFPDMDEAVLTTLRAMLKKSRLSNKQPKPAPNPDNSKAEIAKLDAEIKKLQAQLSKAYEMLEQEVYTIELFRTRNATLTDQITELTRQRDILEKKASAASTKAIDKSMQLPKTEQLLSDFDIMTPEEKNLLFKELFVKIIYTKDPQTSIIKLDLYPRL